jgi:tetratricopeptide (TPR) repeat protein
MKIGSVDVRVYAFVYLAAVLVIGIVILRVYLGNYGAWLEGYYRGSILAAMNSESTATQQEGIDACRAVLKASPQNVSVRLYLVTLLLHQKKFVEAEKESKEAAEIPAASPDEKAYAFMGAGVAHFRAMTNDEPAKYATAAAECEKLYFQKAVDSQKANPDALANLAFCKTLQAPASAGSAMKTCEPLLTGSPPPSLAVLQQLYTLKGLALLQEGKSFDALSEFERAQALQPAGIPGLPTPQDSRRLALLGGIAQKDIAQPQRMSLMLTIEKEIGKYGSQEVAVLNAMGAARSMLSNDADYMKKHFPLAKANFNAAILRDPKEPRAYLNQVSLIENRIADVASTLTVRVSGLNGDPVKDNPWVETPKVEVSAPDRTALNEITTLLHDEDVLWDLFFNKADVGTAERINAKLRHLACVRRQAFMTNDANKAGFFNRALAIAEELVKIEPNNPATHFALAEVLLEQGQSGQQVKAINELNLSKSCGMNTPQLDNLLAALGNSPQLTDVRPSKLGPSFGAVPLIRATLSGINGEAVKGFAMTLDGRQVASMRIGSQVMFLPKADELKDGNHTISLTINDGTGGPPVKLPEFEFKVTKKPPTWTARMEGSAPQPVWKITMKDEAGIDSNSLTLTLKGAGITRKLIKGGKAGMAMLNVGLKSNDAIAINNEFKVSSGSDLVPGSYTLLIDVSNNAGIPLRAELPFEVK